MMLLLPVVYLLFLNMPFLGRWRKLTSYMVAFFFLFQVIVVVLNLSFRPTADSEHFSGFLNFSLHIDYFAKLMLIAIAMTGFVASLVGISTISAERQKFKYFNLLIIALLGMNATVMAADLFSMYVFIEVTAVSAFIMIAMKKDPLSLEGAFKYFLLSSIATVLMLTSIAILLIVSKDMSFTAISAGISAAGASPVIKLAVILFICGTFIKSGLVPFHFWLPDAYAVGPAPTSVMLAGIITKVTGVYVLMRLVLTVFNTAVGLNAAISNVLMTLGMISIIVGALSALTQRNMRRMLAYSSISQVGYMIVGIGCLHPLAIAGAIFHMLNHAMFKSLLFINAASVEEMSGTADMDQLGGLGEKMPVTGSTTMIGLLSTAGVPPTAAFWSKLLIIMGLWMSGHRLLAAGAILASVITLAYLLVMFHKVFFGKIKAGLDNVREADIGMVFPQVFLATLLVWLGVIFPAISGFIISLGKVAQ